MKSSYDASHYKRNSPRIELTTGKFNFRREYTYLNEAFEHHIQKKKYFDINNREMKCEIKNDVLSFKSKS